MTPYDFLDLGSVFRTYTFISYSRKKYVLIKLYKISLDKTLLKIYHQRHVSAL